MKYIYYTALLTVLMGASYLGCNEFIKKTPKKVRQEKAQRETLSEQCGVKADALLTMLFTIQKNEAEMSSKLYHMLRSVACGEPSCIDTMDIEILKNLTQKLENMMTCAKQYNDALVALYGIVE